jgi:antitoxin YefM
MHLDIAVGDLDAAVTEALRLGATQEEEVQPAPDRWRVMRDPAGHIFCVSDRIQEYLTLGYLDLTRPPNRPTSSRQAGDLAADVGLPSITWRPACTSEASDVQFSVRIQLQVAEEDRLVKTMTYSESRAHYAETLNAVVDDREEVVITRAGHEPVVIVALADYESLKETAYLLRSPENARRLLASIDRLENGGGIERDLLG